MTLLHEALSYAARGWPVHPLRFDTGTPWLARDKDAAGVEIPNTGGVRKASTDPRMIRSWWTRWPDARIAAAAGHAIGAFVLDVDVKDADGRTALALLEERHGRLPDTWEAATPSGGQHLYFRQPPELSLRNRVGFAPGLDVRTTGGSITLPPSRKPNGAYAWVGRPRKVGLAEAPAWLLRLIDPPPPPRAPYRPLSPSIRLGAYVRAAVDGECRQLAAMKPNSGRNQRLFQASARLGELVAAGAVDQALVERELEAAAVACGLRVDDGGMAGVLGTIANGLRHGRANPRGQRSDVSPALRRLQQERRGS